jgi:predicted ABC-type ATPase
MLRKKGAPHRSERVHWVDPFTAYDRCVVTDKELKKATKKAIRDITRGKTPVAKKETPHVIITVGAPGSGKSTVAGAATGGNDNYVVIDFDVAIKYHPRYHNLWIPTETSGNKAKDIKFTMTHGICNDAVEDVLVEVAEEISFRSRKQYNLILQSHNLNLIIKYKRAGYKVTLLFVGVPLKVAIQRSRDRAINTGQFLAPTLMAQEDVIVSMWHHYLEHTPWYAMWADELLVVNNSKVLKDPKNKMGDLAKRIQRVEIHGSDWMARLRHAESVIRKAVGKAAR